MPKHASYEDRFLEKVHKTETCWLWVGALNSRGYGSFTYQKKAMSAHRFSYQHFKGKIPDGMIICHSCDIPACVNPEHLWVGTYKDNSDDCYKKGRNRQSMGNPNGHNQFKNNKTIRESQLT